ncbi:MAG TPA: hypothetical protein VK753_03900 [Xanthomonadaceae bacterium]|jgi:hypothetical protein|nr:hypothetical protein [Xanthomonadaceae bacterium]
MKDRTVSHALAAIAMTGLLAACSASKAPDSSIALSLPADQPAAAASGATQSGPSGEPATPIPAATDDIWKAIDKQSADLQKIVQNGTLKEVQHKADAIRDLVAALPAHATKLSADAQTKLQQDATLVATLVEHLDAAANAGDQAGAKTNYTKLNTALGAMTRFP